MVPGLCPWLRSSVVFSLHSAVGRTSPVLCCGACWVQRASRLVGCGDSALQRAHRSLQAWVPPQRSRALAGRPSSLHGDFLGGGPGVLVPLVAGLPETGSREHAASLPAEPCEPLAVTHAVWPPWVSAGGRGPGEAELLRPRPGLGLSCRRLAPCGDLSTLRSFLGSSVLSLWFLSKWLLFSRRVCQLGGLGKALDVCMLSLSHDTSPSCFLAVTSQSVLRSLRLSRNLTCLTLP